LGRGKRLTTGYFACSTGSVPNNTVVPMHCILYHADPCNPKWSTTNQSIKRPRTHNSSHRQSHSVDRERTKERYWLTLTAGAVDLVLFLEGEGSQPAWSNIDGR
jgi:hypothetical protein